MKKLNVLVSAYACEPDKGSEPGVGWHWVKQIARFHEAWVVTKKNNRPAIEKELKNNPDPNLHFIYVDLPPWLSFWKRGQRGVRTYYYLWQFAALKKILTLNENIKFDIAHHVTFVNDWLFSFLSLLPYPYIWGPIGSHPSIPRPFLRTTKEYLFNQLRLLIQYSFRFIDPLFYLTLFRAKKIILISTPINRIFPFCFVRQINKTIQIAIGIETNIVPDRINKDEDEITIISVGRLINLKGFDLVINSFSLAQKEGINNKLRIIGDGNHRNKLEKQSISKKIDHKTEFLGNIPREEVLKHMNNADIFLFPSFEGGGMVVLEAMAAQLPVVCLDFGGPGEMVTEECGVKITPITPDQTEQEIAEALCTLSGDKNLRLKMGKASRKRAETLYNWDEKGNLVKELYENCFKKR